jgi:Asp/Glu/Hydantoin racemase
VVVPSRWTRRIVLSVPQETVRAPGSRFEHVHPATDKRDVSNTADQRTGRWRGLARRQAIGNRRAHTLRVDLRDAGRKAATVRTHIRQAGLLGTRYTMERGFYRGRLQTVHGLSVLVPEEPDRALVHQIIYDELVQGIIRDESRNRYLEVIDRLRQRGAEGIIAGCTGIELLVQGNDVDLPYFPTTRLHALAAVDMALAGC